MRIDLLGTGSADRWPNPWCGCAQCTWARATGAHRARTSALVDRVLLIDPGPDVGSRGVDLTQVRTVLITHDHPDHLDPAFLLAWSWAGGAPLTVAGPQAAVDRCREWVGPEAAVRWTVLGSGDELTSPGAGSTADAADAGLRVRALPAAHSTTGDDGYDDTALLYEVLADGCRLLYATDTAALAHESLTGRYDVVLLELTFGEHTTHGTAHLDLPSFGREVALLRAADRLADGARVIAVHLSHHNPVDLVDRLARIGAEVLPDGATVFGGSGPTRPGRGLLVTGGARSGKSHYAETVVAARRPVTYVATAPAYPQDPEWATRIAAHRNRRPPEWRVLETTAVAHVLASSAPGETVLVDCLTLWVTTLVDGIGAWGDAGRATMVVGRATSELVGALRRSPADVVLVTNEVGAGIAPTSESGRLFRDLLGHVNASVAAACDDAVQLVSGIPQQLKGRAWTPSST